LVTRTSAALLGLAVLCGACTGGGPATARSSPRAESPGAPLSPATTATTAAPATASDAEIDAAIADAEQPRSSREPLKSPPELMLYPDRKRFLAIQVAAANTEKYARPSDLASLARLVRDGELQTLPALGQDYVLDGVGEDVKEDPLAHFDAATGLEVPLVADPAEAEREAAELSASKRPKDAERAALMRKLYGDPASRALLARDYEAVTALAKDFGGETYDLRDPEDREAFQSRLLSALRPAARQVMLELAAKYHARFGRCLPVVSMVRTERYQRLLSRVNANATHIDVPPHTTGEAFDITYRYMPSDEQNFLMAEIAALEDAGKVEALRERRNCFHVFCFASGHGPEETAIAAARAAIVADQEEEPERPARKPRHVRRARRR
jgi:Family of unknown function (DUF5715)